MPLEKTFNLLVGGICGIFRVHRSAESKAEGQGMAILFKRRG